MAYKVIFEKKTHILINVSFLYFGTFNLIYIDVHPPVTGRNNLMHNRSLSMMKLLLEAVVTSSMFCGTSADSAFFLVGSDLTTCVGISKLHTTRCNEGDEMEVHCVLDEAYRLGIGYLRKIWVPRGSCPFYRRDFGVLDYRYCVAEALACPNNIDLYLSNDVYKYPGCLQESTTARGSTQTPASITKDSTIRNEMTTVGMNEIDFSSHNPWLFVGSICLGLLIVAVIMFALMLLRRRKDRKGKWSVRYNDPNVSYISRGQILTTNNEDCYLITDTTPLVAPMKNKKFQDNRSPIVSTWPKAFALEREKAIFQLNPIYLSEPDA